MLAWQEQRWKRFIASRAMRRPWLFETELQEMTIDADGVGTAENRTACPWAKAVGLFVLPPPKEKLHQ